MSLSLLGAPLGTLIKGNQCYNKDLTLRLHSDVYPYVNDEVFKDLSNNRAEILRLARRYRTDLFASRSDDYIIKWLTNNRVNGNGKGSEYLPNNTLVEVISSAGEKSKLPPSMVTGIMSVGDIQEVLPKKTLSFYYHSWDIILEDYEVNIDSVRDKYAIKDGRVIHIKDVDKYFTKVYKLNINQEDIYIIGEQIDTNSYVQELIDEHDLRDTYDKLIRSTSYFTPAGYKSLLQKIIRVRPAYIRLEDNIHIQAHKALMTTFLMLYDCGGSFVPDLGRFVSGKESAFKRLAVSIVEDSYTDDMYAISTMLEDALICQYDRSYNPSKSRLTQCLLECAKVMIETGYFSYELYINDRSLSSIPTYSDVIKTSTPYNISAFLINIIGSFKGDINMFATLNPNRLVDLIRSKYIEKTYDLYRCIDQHWAPSVSYLLPLELVREMISSVKTKAVLEPVMKFIWDYSSSYNPRRNNLKSIDNWHIIGITQRTYHLFNLGRYNDIPNASSNHRQCIPIDDVNTTIIGYTLPESYLSVHVGMYYPKSNSSRVMACLDANNIYNISTSKMPSRDMNTSDTTSILSPKIESNLIAEFKTVLRTQGIKGVKLINDDTEYIINDVPLSKWLQREVKTVEFDWSNDYATDASNGLLLATDVDDISFHDIEAVIDPLNSIYTPNEINRAKYYLLRSNTELRMPSISKNGEGVTKSDIGAYNIINRIASYYPFLLKQRKIGVFDVPHHTLIRRLLPKLIANTKKSKKIHAKSQLPYDILKRTPYQHQIETLNEMKCNKNNFIWIPVGMGKTYIIITYLIHLISTKKINKYILYTLPTSAFESVKIEFDHWNIDINVINPIGGNKWSMIPINNGNTYTVNLINHDHLRKIDHVLERYISDTILIVDEVHKTLADTKRTDVALTLASLSSRFILLTGTPLINTKMSMLINWLQLIVRYPINKHNFWIAITSMISKQANTGVLVKKENVYVPMKGRLLTSFKKLVGPSLGGTNSKVTEKDFRMAIDITYEAVNNRLVSLAIKHIDEGVFLIANNKTHQDMLYRLLLKQKSIKPDDVGMMTKDNLYNLVSIDDPGPKIIITTTRLSEGYTLTKLGVLVTSVYFSNLATRQQLEGRINRITQTRKQVTHHIVYTDLLDLILKNYNHASSISNALKLLVK